MNKMASPKTSVTALVTMMAVSILMNQYFGPGAMIVSSAAIMTPHVSYKEIPI